MKQFRILRNERSSFVASWERQRPEDDGSWIAPREGVPPILGRFRGATLQHHESQVVSEATATGSQAR